MLTRTVISYLKVSDRAITSVGYANEKSLLGSFCLLLLTVGCTGINSTNSENISNSQTTVPSAIATSKNDRLSKLRDRIERISETARGRVGVAATVLETGESVSLNGDLRFPMLSVYKFPIAMSKPSQALLRRLMTETSTGKQRIKGLLPKGTVVAHKTGTSGTVKGVTAATNDVGIITLPNGQHLAIAIFVSNSTAEAAIREGVIAKIAKAAWDEWSQ